MAQDLKTDRWIIQRSMSMLTYDYNRTVKLYITAFPSLIEFYKVMSGFS